MFIQHRFRIQRGYSERQGKKPKWTNDNLAANIIYFGPLQLYLRTIKSNIWRTYNHIGGKYINTVIFGKNTVIFGGKNSLKM